MAKFDDARPYGECSPVENGIAYWQAPNLFDAKFNHINEKGEVQEYASGNKAPPLRTKKMTGLDMPDAKVEPVVEAAPAVEDAPQSDDAVDAALDTNSIDLLAWARGEVKGVPFFSIRKKMVEDGYESPDTAIAAKDAIMARLGKPDA